MSAHPPKDEAGSVEDLWATIGKLLDAFTLAECANSFAATGYDST